MRVRNVGVHVEINKENVVVSVVEVEDVADMLLAQEMDVRWMTV